MDVGAWVDGVTGALLPEACGACDAVLGEGEGEGAFCADCWAQVTELPSVGCARCGEPGRYQRVCERCEASTPPFERAWAAFEHEGPMARAIHRFKYEDRADLARPLGRLLAGRLRRLGWPAATVVPVPLHVERFRTRHFDQAALLAVVVASRLGWALDLVSLERVLPTRRQVGLDDHQREDNVAKAFAARHGLVGARVVLLDDVFTTGATARETSRVLLRAGAAGVRVVTLARAARESSTSRRAPSRH